MNRKYVISVERISLPKQVDTKGANAVIFVNRGQATALINGEEIATDQMVSNSGLEGEQDNTLYDIKFSNSGGQTQVVFMRIKRYVP